MSIKRRFPASKSAILIKSKTIACAHPTDACERECPHFHTCAFMGAINAALISFPARYLAGVIAAELGEIIRKMRVQDDCFFAAVRACPGRYPAGVDLSDDKRFWRILRECLDAGIFLPDVIYNRAVFFPRLPNGARPC